MKSLGADRVIDDTKEDFTSAAKTYDLIFDIVGATSCRFCRHSLKLRESFPQNIMASGKRHGWDLVDVKCCRQEAEERPRHDSPARMDVIAERVMAAHSTYRDHFVQTIVINHSGPS